MTKTIYPASLLCDFYKVSHKDQYPVGTEKVYSTFTPRSNRYFPVANEVVVFGIQGFVKKYLIEYFNKHFFNRSKEDVVNEYSRIIKYTLGIENPDVKHIKELHDLGYIPLEIKALKEGTLAPIKTPVLTIENTSQKFFWVTNYIETLISAEIWQAMTSATVSNEYRKLLDKYAIETNGSVEGVDFQAHDFSFRGMAGLDAMAKSSAGHLLSFTGSDSIPAISYLEHYYNANVENELVAGSIPASEHSTMCANTLADGDRDEYDAFKRIITEVYPNGLVSVVSDSYDFWKVVGETLPKLKDDIMSRDGKVVIRPDSGCPVKTLVGDPNSNNKLVRKGLVECLYDLFGGTVNEQGYKVLDSHIGAIYGDSITLERAEQIVEGLKKKDFASINVVLGVGSYSFQYHTRDSFGFAMKATHTTVNGEGRMLFKDPKTDDGTKRSQRGRVHVYRNNGKIEFADGLNSNEDSMAKTLCLLETVFKDGKLVRDQSLQEIREILKQEEMKKNDQRKI